MPSSDSPFDFEEAHVPRGKASNADMKRPQPHLDDPAVTKRIRRAPVRRILVCFMPTTYGQSRLIQCRDDPWLEEGIVVSKAHVNLYKAKNN